MSASSLARIPFRAEEERLIESTARWMRFIAVVTVIGGLLMSFVVLVAFALAALFASSVGVTLGRGLRIEQAPLGYAAVAAGAALAMSCVSVYSGYVLYRSAESFDRMARTDGADQFYLVEGVRGLTRYLQIYVLVAFLSVAMGLATVVAATAAGFAFKAAA